MNSEKIIYSNYLLTDFIFNKSTSEALGLMESTNLILPKFPKLEDIISSEFTS